MGIVWAGPWRRWVTALTVSLVVLGAGSAAAVAASPPTLGLTSAAPTGAGFGHAKPRTISYGGDPTSFVSRITWRSWGGSRALGHGVADWVWPGWCVACGSVELPATVVAFGRTRCGGHAAYSRVEWFFPSRGMTFDRRLSEGDLCGRPTPSGPVPAERQCGRVALGTSAYRATSITMFGSPISCAAARRFVAGSGAARYAGRNARFTEHGWWCGSELSMDINGVQNVSCERGDFTNVSFNLTRR